ncbi:MAG: Sec23-binding domain of Sec16-domain-containing protein [Benniella sp.]|nr:MAG: Sec23-binding domain of Sec16-domain-containing protein [Benniella sp.]
MSQPYRYQHQQHQQQPPPVQEGQIPFFGGNGNPQRPPPHQARPPFNRPPNQQQQQQRPPPQPSYRPLHRPPPPQRHPQQHPHPSSQQVQQAQQQNRPTPISQQPPVSFGATPHVMLQPCPFPECSGENKPQAKFCSECGRPISTASRSATPHLGPRPDSALSHSTPMAKPAEPERIDDPLNRYLGCPLVVFGFGGKIMTWFPRGKQAATSAFDQGSCPLIQQHISEITLMDTRIATYPGPLLMASSVQLKSKLEDVMKLIEHRINEYGQPHEDNIRDVHRILIWKLLKVMLEQEGTLTGGARIDEAVRSVLRSIPFANLPREAIQQKTSDHESASIDTLQELLRQGNLAASIRHAIDSQLWAHALVISSHGDRELWNEVVSSFVNHELSTTSGKANGRESLRVLYTILSGQSERAIAELVPQSLRDQYLETKDDLSKRIEVPDQNLIQWRDTLTLILSNRTEGDQTIINSLGNLLRKEGWIEAAHICYLLSPQVSVHSGPDVHDTSMVFLSVDHDLHAIYPYYKNVLSFQETEVYEFGCALRNPDAIEGLPFFQAYKLIYVWRLLEEGMFSEAIR